MGLKFFLIVIFLFYELFSQRSKIRNYYVDKFQIYFLRIFNINNKIFII